MTSSDSPEPVTLLIKPDCHLCGDALHIAREVCLEFGLSLSEQSIFDGSGALLPEYVQFAEEVPVLLIDGIQRDFWKIDPVRMRRLLAVRRDSGGTD
ncbi:glutaredoxin family protein [Psychromicrobium lacuslunae]|uniref:Glutaredoxin n=1 Tax=Psychromicrobium lacuslunae TaxID=1618207 RepID=A0A0D4C0I5_9MICC|nr:glutaredoxin family protein [Psychromicrobium lacuslunae]AJT41930.1 hypothetical protein UM93_11140 [Psychromicrobium lacuslunae]